MSFIKKKAKKKAKKDALLVGSTGNLGPIWRSILEDNHINVYEFDPNIAPSIFERNVNACRPRMIAYEKRTMPTPDIIVYNAGIDNPPSATGYVNTYTEMAKIMMVNWEGYCNIVKAFACDMIANGGGNITAIGSILGFVSPDHRNYGDRFDKPIAYPASKAALWQSVKYYVTRYSKCNLIFNMLALSAVEGGQSEEFKDNYLKNVPLGQMLERRHFENEFMACVTARSPYGFPILVDGGYTSW